MAIQVSLFSDGGAVAHKVTAEFFKGRVSVWFGAHGRAVDMEQILPSGNSRPVLMGGMIWRHCEERAYLAVQHVRRNHAAFEADKAARTFVA